MEIANSVIILLFVISIFSNLPGRQAGLGKKETSYEANKSKQSVAMNYSALPLSNFSISTEAETKESLNRFVLPRAKKISADEAGLLVDSIMKYSKEYDVNPKLVAALIDRESSFNPRSVSSSNAQGLAQLLPSTARDIGISDPFDIEEGTKGAALYLKMMMDKWRGLSDQVVLALASYAEGFNQIFRADRSYSSKTAQYVKDILDRCYQMN